MPNVLILMSDEHNPFVASVYGHPSVRTPNMERMAKDGAIYDAAYCPSPLCQPCRSSFMSGRRVHEIQAYNNCPLLLQQDIPTYGRALAEQGIHTVHIGKTHVYAPGKTLGFSEIIDPTEVVGDTNFGRQPLCLRLGAEQRANGYGVKAGAHDSDLAKVDAAIAWLERQGRTSKTPWVLVVQVVAPHFPHFTNEELWALYPDGGDLPALGSDSQTARHPYAQDLRDHFRTHLFSEEQVRGLRRGYLSRVTFVDRQLGRLLDALERNGLRDNTAAIYTADHGEMLGKFGMWWKCSMFEDSVRVPLIASGPGFARGARVTTPVDLLDVQASIFEATGAKRPAHWTGSPLQKIPADDENRAVFSEYHGHGTRSGAFMIRKGDWKLIWCAQAPHQLFNLASDRQELENIYKSQPAVAADLERELRRVCNPELENERAHAFERRQLDELQRVHQ